MEEALPIHSSLSHYDVHLEPSSRFDPRIRATRKPPSDEAVDRWTGEQTLRKGPPGPQRQLGQLILKDH